MARLDGQTRCPRLDAPDPVSTLDRRTKAYNCGDGSRCGLRTAGSWVDTTTDKTSSVLRRAPDRANVTRVALLIAAAEQFYTAGYQGGSLTEIAAHAGVTKGALYFHFPHKRALADAVISEMNTAWAATVAAIMARGFDPLATMLAATDAGVIALTADPITRGGVRLERDPLLRGATAVDPIARRFRYSEAALAAQLAAAAAAGLLRPEIVAPRRTRRTAQSIIATITGHHLICDLTGTDDQLWDRVTAMWQDLLPAIATDTWLEHWRAEDWTRRPHPPDPRPQTPLVGLDARSTAF